MMPKPSPLSPPMLAALCAAAKLDTTLMDTFTGETWTALVNRKLVTPASRRIWHRVTPAGRAALTDQASKEAV